MARAKSILEQLSADPSAQEAARQRELALLNWNHSHHVAREEGKAEGKAEGEAKGVLVVLRARGLVVSADVEARVIGCTDIALLDEWLRRAAIVASAEEIFG